MNTVQTTQRVTFSTIAMVLVPFGVATMQTNVWVGLFIVGMGIVSLVLREVFKSE